MVEIKLQYSLILAREENYLLKKMINIFKPGRMDFYITNKWIWDGEEQDDMADDGFYQLTEIMEGDHLLASSRSPFFKMRFSHTHYNLFRGIDFLVDKSYRVRIKLFAKDGFCIESGSLDYPLFIRDE